jgi:hypothetical protein
MRNPGRVLPAILLLIASLLSAPVAAVRATECAQLEQEPSDDERWDDGFGFGLAATTREQVKAIAIDGKNVYVGGRFVTAGGIAARQVARWDGSVWSDMAGGIDYPFHFSSPSINTLAVKDGQLYAGGNFASIGGVATMMVSRWDGSAWNQVSGGVNIGNSLGALSINQLKVDGYEHPVRYCRS